MFSEEEPELRDLIIQNLENCGFLSKIKAELRAGVFLAFEEDGDLKKKVPLFNEKFEKFVATYEGKLMLSVVREFLEYFSLDFTISVFDPEVSSSSPLFSRSELCDHLNLKATEVNGPVISEIFKGIGNERKSNPEKISSGIKSVPEKSLSNLNDLETEKLLSESAFKLENSKLDKIKSSQNNDIEIGSVSKSFKDGMKETFDGESTFLVQAMGDISKNKISKDIPLEKYDGTKASEKFKESKDLLSSDHDPFFDEPVPSEKSFFSFSDTLKDKSESKPTSIIKSDLDESKRSSLSSLKDLPSLSSNHEWTFTRDPLSDFANLDLLKSSTDTSKKQTENLDSKIIFEKKDPDIGELNEDLSEKQISEESIVEELLEDDSSAAADEFLPSSLSLGDDATTDQTVSQTSVVEGVDHIEPCNS